MWLLLDHSNEQSQGTCVHTQPHLFLDRPTYTENHEFAPVSSIRHSRVHSGFFFFHISTPCSHLFWGSTYHPSDHVQAARAEAPERWSGQAPTCRSLVHTHVQCWLLPPCLHPSRPSCWGTSKAKWGTPNTLGSFVVAFSPVTPSTSYLTSVIYFHGHNLDLGIQ